MARINLNKVAKEVCKREGLKVNLSIAQVKEVMKHYNDILCNYDVYDVVMLLHRAVPFLGLDTRAERRHLKKFLEDNNIF